MFECLTDEHPIERIPVVKSKIGQTSYRGFVKRQRLDSVLLPLDG
jgi:hypothetical protein